MPDEITFNPQSLTLNEADLLEELSGRPVGELMVGLLRGKFSAKDLRAIATVVRRRNDPEFTADQLDGDMRIEGMLVDIAASGMLSDAVADG